MQPLGEPGNQRSQLGTLGGLASATGSVPPRASVYLPPRPSGPRDRLVQNMAQRPGGFTQGKLWRKARTPDGFKVGRKGFPWWSSS